MCDESLDGVAHRTGPVLVVADRQQQPVAVDDRWVFLEVGDLLQAIVQAADLLPDVPVSILPERLYAVTD